MNNDKKEIFITKDSSLMDIQSAFSAFFPFLKIDFLQPDTVSKSLRGITIHPQTSLKSLTDINTPKIINVDNCRTVSEICDDFKHTLGYTVEVSRKSGKVWNVISVTDGWTLEGQNSAGKHISSLMSAPPDKN